MRRPLVAVVALTPLVASAQTAPRTSWGDPDLQGVFDYSSITPMQRPQQYADRESVLDGSWHEGR